MAATLVEGRLTPARFDDEPLIDRLTESERNEVQAQYFRAWWARQWRAAWGQKFGIVPANVPMPGRYVKMRSNTAVRRNGAETRRATASHDHAHVSLR